jgi:AraC-like DNA-binding protein
VNGDRVHDILVGAPANGAGHVDLHSGATGELLHRFVGVQSGDYFGWSVSSAGDVNHDRGGDVLIGGSQFGSGAGPGYADVYSGETYELLRRLTGDAVGDQFGSGAGWSRDVNRDHVPDQIIGARHANGRGQVYVYSGGTGDRLLTIDASSHGGQLGSFFVAGMGDVNRDGTPDIYAADYSDTTNGSDPGAGNAAGRAAVYSGRDGHELLAWLGSDADAGLGPGRGAGDVNHDGHPDLTVGSFSSNAGALNAGRVQIFSGADESVLRTITSTTANEQFGFDAVGLGDTNRDGAPDELVAAATGDHVYGVANVVRSATELFRTPPLTVGEFRCPPGDDAWRETNLIGDRPHVVFPRVPVLIRHVDAEPVLATPNHTMLYNGDQHYLRELRNDAGDDCVYIELADGCLATLAEEGAELVDRDSRLRLSHTPADRRTYLLQHLLVRHLRGPKPDPLLAEESAALLVLSALRQCSSPPRARRHRTAAAHRELAEEAKAELASAPGKRVSLHELARRLHASAFHLARVFRAETGFSLYGFQQSLRLRSALERLRNATDLSALALELGFSSHSHFTARFRDEFGLAPSQVRDEPQMRALLRAATRG